jgi:cysteine desulfurase
MQQPVIYFDHAAATPLDDRGLAAMLPYFADQFYNPSSPYAQALTVKRAYQDAKARIAQCIGAKADELVMTAGATESINLAFNSVGGHVVTSNVEHDSVLAAALSREYTLVQADERGYVSAEAVAKALRPDTTLVSIQLANNELGTIQPLRAIAAVIAKERERRKAAGDTTPIYFHSDASQGLGQLEIHVSRLGVDLLTLNAGKIYGPKQVGLLWVAPAVTVRPVVVGGGQENGLRSGTENVAGVIGFARALELASKHRKSESERLSELEKNARQQLAAAFPDAVFSGHPKHHLQGFIHVSFPGVDAERLVFALERRGILVATGSACAANKNTRSHVLAAISLADEVADGSLRLTFGHLSDQESVAQGIDGIIDEVRREKERTA